MPQIEVTFDIDANGILHVSAKDKGTGKEQSIRITASSGLSDDEIDRMVKEAEAHSGEDSKKKALIEVKNEADSLIYTVEKTLAEHGDKLSEEDKKEIESALENCKNSKEKSDNPVEIRTTVTALSTASHKIAEHMYKDTASAQGPEGGNGHGCGGGTCGTEQNGGQKEETIEAEFEEETAGK